MTKGETFQQLMNTGSRERSKDSNQGDNSDITNISNHKPGVINVASNDIEGQITTAKQAKGVKPEDIEKIVEKVGMRLRKT